MLHAFDPRYMYCSRKKKSVRVCGAQAECRSKHGCNKPNCPLTKEFGLEAFDGRMKAFATTFDLWPLGDKEEKDFP
jgi:hypothetical protein